MWLLKLLSFLPLWFLYRLSDVVYLFIYYITPYRKKEVFEHLRRSFPEKSATEIKKIAKNFYRNIADVLVESIKAISISENELAKRVIFNNAELLQPWIDKQQSMIFMAAHQCNWEWLLLGSCVHFPFPLDAVYKPLHYPAGDQLMYDIRARFAAKPIAVKQTIMEMMKRRNELRGFALVADQSPLQDEEKYWTTFLQQDTPFPVGAEKIARLTQYPVFFVNMRRIKRGYYAVRLELLAAPPYAKEEGYPIIAAYAQATERQILQQPQDWLWSYRKWKYHKPIYD